MVTFFLSRNGVHTYIFRKRLSPVSLFYFLPSLPSFIISNAFFFVRVSVRGRIPGIFLSWW